MLSSTTFLPSLTPPARRDGVPQASFPPSHDDDDPGQGQSGDDRLEALVGRRDAPRRSQALPERRGAQDEYDRFRRGRPAERRRTARAEAVEEDADRAQR